jgi:hypothetical protein
MTEATRGRRRRLTREDLLSPADYAAVRRERRRQIAESKRRRRLEVGPCATFHFENIDTMRQQIEEMLFIEKGGEAQLQDELDAYNSLIPQGRELVATVMFEIDDPLRRAAMLMRLGGIERHVFIEIDGERVRGVPDATRENTSPAGKASAVQFLHFPFASRQIGRFKTPGAAVAAGFDHPNYGHLAIVPEPVRAALAEDFD